MRGHHEVSFAGDGGKHLLEFPHLSDIFLAPPRCVNQDKIEVGKLLKSGRNLGTVVGDADRNVNDLRVIFELFGSMNVPRSFSVSTRDKYRFASFLVANVLGAGVNSPVSRRLPLCDG